MRAIIFLIFAIIVTAAVLAILHKPYDEPEFVSSKSSNFNNIEYFNGTYNGKTVKISPHLDWIEYKERRYLYKDTYMYKTSDDRHIKLNKNIFYYIDTPVYSKTQIHHNHNIPKIIWQTGPKDNTKFSKNIDTFRNQKGWRYEYLDNDMGESFLKENFKEEVLQTFRTLKPGAFKADLLRACLLYIHGGVYADIKLNLHCNLDSFLDRDLVVTRELGRHLNKGIWNGFIASTPRNEYFKEVIDAIVENVKNRYYGETPLYVTGPILYGKIFMKKYNIDSIEEGVTDKYRILNTIRLRNDNKIVINEVYNHEIFISWDYARKYTKHYKTKDYSTAWKNRDIYND